MTPVRVQLRRTKGWRMPENTVSVARPGRFGNPFTVAGCREAGYQGTDDQIAARCVEAFRVWLGPMWRNNWDGDESEKARAALLAGMDDLRGKSLACWCAPDSPYHADALLELANAPVRQHLEQGATAGEVAASTADHTITAEGAQP